MTEELDAILFDAGGTLFDLRPSKEDIFSQVLRANGFEPDRWALARSMAKAERSLDEEFSRVEGRDESGYWMKHDTIVLSDLGFKGDFGDMSAKISAEFRSVIPRVDSWRDYPETKPILAGLRRRDFRLGVVSNATDLARKVLDNLDLTRLFDFVLISSEVGIRKPNPEIFRMAARKAETAPNRAMYIGDRFTTDVLGAARVGMNAVLLDRADAYPDCLCLREKDLNFLRAFS